MNIRRIGNCLMHHGSIALMAGGLLLAGPAVAGKKDDTLRFAAEQLPESIDPYFNSLRIGEIVAATVWDTLVYRDPKTNEMKGQLAKSWRRVADKTYEFELRQGIKFHNGEDFDADSVVYTLNFVSDPNSKVKTQGNVDWIEKVEKIEKYKVRLTTKTVFPAALQYLSAAPVVIHPAKYYAEVGPKGMSAKPVGTGPYKVVTYTPGKSLVLERNKDYFSESPRAKPQIGKIEIRFIPDRQTQMAEVLSGGVDLITNVQHDQAEQAKSVPGLQVVAGESMRVAFIQLNELEGGPNPALKDVRVRKAIAHAIDRAGIVKNIVGSGSRVVHVLCHPSQFGCQDEGAARYEYDPARAKKLLVDAGYPNGFETEIIANRDRNQTEAIIGNLAAVGIKAKLAFMQAAAGRDLVRANKAQLAHRTWGSSDITDISAFTPAFLGFEPDDIARDVTVSLMLTKGNRSLQPRERADAYKIALALTAERAHVLPLWTLPVQFVAVKDLRVTESNETPRFWEMSWK